MLHWIKSIKISMLLSLGIVASNCGAPHGGTQAVADYGKALGLVKTEIEVEDRTVEAWQFMLCDRFELLHADNIASLLANPEVCYNPLVDAEGGAAVFISPPETGAARTKTAALWVVKGLVVAGGGVLAFFSIKFGFKTWKWFTNMETYIRYSQSLKRELAAQARDAKGLEKKNRLLAWITGGGMLGIVAGVFLVGDGAFTMLGQVWNINKTYFNKGKKAVLEWGRPEQTYINDYPYLVNDAWQDTKKTDSIDRLLVGIKNTLKCEFSPRYIEENPLRAP